MPPENLEALREIALFTSVPIAVCERLYTRWGFKDVITEGVVDIVQPDLSHAGGIWEVRKFAAMAEAFDVAVAPHCPLGLIAFAASLQLDACTPNVVIQESSSGIHYNVGHDLLDYVLEVGPSPAGTATFLCPRAPGSASRSTRSWCAFARKGHDWTSPIWRNADGTVAEW